MATHHPTGLDSAPGATLARHRVRDGIQRLILSGEYQPGQRLVQQELAGRFGVAQSVVRESLLELQFCGLVEAVDNLGMFVSGLGRRRRCWRRTRSARCSRAWLPGSAASGSAGRTSAS